MTNQALEQTIRRVFPLYDKLPAKDQAFVLNQIREETHAAGTLLMDGAGTCQDVYFLLEGSIRLTRLSPDGREITLYRVAPGEMCLFTLGCLLDGEPLDAVAQVEQPSRLIVFPGAAFKVLFSRSPSFRQYVLIRMFTALTDLMMLTEEVAFHSMSRRLADHLLQLSGETGHSHLHTTHEQIALELGTAREVISRLLKEMEKRQLVRLARGTVTLLNQQELKKIAGL